MNEDQQERIPKVFISYSHDTPQHKTWVAELAAKLVDKGIDVTFDRWDLKRGSDVPKYMEKSVAWADRVLMICTEAYVRKANEGKGGVGYEAMIVTGELVKDLGTDKFIPVIRQDNGGKEVPRFMATRFYVNLSEGEKLAEDFEELLRELHNEPALKKPPIGKNPFAKTPAGNESRTIITPTPLSVPEPLPDEGSFTYQKALEIARQGDLVLWRQLVKEAKSPVTSRLAEWRQRWETKRAKEGLTTDELETVCHEGLFAYWPLMCIALAGVESGTHAIKFPSPVGAASIRCSGAVSAPVSSVIDRRYKNGMAPCSGGL